ncbi:MAG TPA: radical SAM protein, partial [Desulfomicrobium sp.]|nr:radical SAM protein [Desulfomicrobium sp.]
MLCGRAGELSLPRPDEFIPLPEESEFFLLPGRRALGLDPESGQVEVLEESAVAAFVAPGYTLTAHAAFEKDPGAPVLPLFAYGAVGFAEGRFWVCAKQVDEDKRQVFCGIPRARIEKGAQEMLRDLPDNRLVRHLTHCALTYGCPAARNLALGRFEAPLPTSRVCNARCLGCISLQEAPECCPSSQERITFVPTVEELCQVAVPHLQQAENAIVSFGQGCEGDPILQADVICDAIRSMRCQTARGTINFNSNASDPDAVERLADAGLDSIRVSMNSVLEEAYQAYHRPCGYTLEQVRESLRRAKARGLFTMLNYLVFPGLSDRREEIDALVRLVEETGIDLIQMRNLSIDPQLYLNALDVRGEGIGMASMLAEIKQRVPRIQFGYFNRTRDNFFPAGY